MEKSSVQKLKDLLKIKGSDSAFQEFIVEEMSDPKIRKQKIEFPYLESKLDLERFLNPECWEVEKKDTEWHLSLDEKRIKVSYKQLIGKIDVVIDADFLLIPPDEMAFCFNHYYIWMNKEKTQRGKVKLTSLNIEDMAWEPNFVNKVIDGLDKFFTKLVVR